MAVYKEKDMILTDYLRSEKDLSWDIARQCGVQHATIRLPEDGKFNLNDRTHWETLHKKYTDFDVSDGLKVVFTDEMGKKKSIDFLSGGTKDMTYVAMRAALIDMLYTEKPPVCFDESFAHQDNVRARAMMKAIGHIANEGCQSFIFTCRGREAALAKELVRGASVYRLSALDEG